MDVVHTFLKWMLQVMSKKSKEFISKQTKNKEKLPTKKDENEEYRYQSYKHKWTAKCLERPVFESTLQNLFRKSMERELAYVETHETNVLYFGTTTRDYTMYRGRNEE